MKIIETGSVQAKKPTFSLEQVENSECAPVCYSDGCHPEGSDCGGSISH